MPKQTKASKSRQHHVELLSNLNSSWPAAKTSPNPPQTHPKPSKNPSQTLPRAPQERPRASRSAHERPRARQERPTSAPRTPQERPRAPECCQNPLQDLPKWSPNRYKNKFLRVFVACVFQHEFSIHFFVIFRICFMSPTLNFIGFLEGKLYFSPNCNFRSTSKKSLKIPQKSFQNP